MLNVVVVMGVAGSGKSTVGPLLAKRLNGIFLEGDHFHPPANIQKMASGHPLMDEDRWPWLDAIGRELQKNDEVAPIVLACSALRKSYRQRLAHYIPNLCFVYLKGSLGTLAERLSNRQGHFMPPTLLQSQLETLEEPEPDEVAIAIDTKRDPDKIVDTVQAELRNRKLV